MIPSYNVRHHTEIAGPDTRMLKIFPFKISALNHNVEFHFPFVISYRTEIS